MHVKAFEYMIANDCLPCNVKFMIEGEEELVLKFKLVCRKKPRKIGKRRYFNFRYGNDFQPTSITTGLRGLSYVEVEVTGPNRDLHSGLWWCSC
jgi:acetylornithine deacetylase/succinyl-diaminopimelate desuccinylase-like protein